MTGASEQKPRSADSGKGRLRAWLYLGAAIVAALGTAVLLTRYMDARIAAIRVPTEKVVVAASDLSMATKLQPEQLAVIDWPTASRPGGTVKDPKELEGKVVNAAIAKGEPIMLSKIAAGDGKSALSTVLPAGMRAVSVRVDDVIGVAGFIHPGDHVDVIVTMVPQTHGDNPPPVSKIILQDIKVLAVGKELESRTKDPQKPVPATVATLMVNGEESEKLALAASKGQLLLALRSGIDSEVVATSGIAPQTLLGMSRPASEPEKVERVVDHARGRARKQAVVKAAVPPPPAKPETKMVEILRGDMFEKRDFQKDGNP
jgi:pilus assembly protein CpaB